MEKKNKNFPESIYKRTYVDFLLWSFGGFCAFTLYGSIEVILNLIYNGEVFFLSPLEIIFFYGISGVIIGAVLKLLFVPLSFFLKEPFKSSFFPFILLLHILGTFDLTLYLNRNYPERFLLFSLFLFHFVLCSLGGCCIVFFRFYKKKNHIFSEKLAQKIKIKTKILFFFILFFFLYLIYPMVSRYFSGVFSHDLPSKKNLVLIVADNLRADFLECYGFKGQTSPNLNKMAKEGVLFEQCYSNAEWTLPSHASLFTGLYPSTHRVVGTKGNSTFLLPEFHTLGEYLEGAGYKTVAFSDNLFVSGVYGFAQGFSSFTEMFETFPPYLIFRVLRKFFISSYFTNGYKAPTTDMILAGFKIWFFRQYTPRKPFFAFFNLMDCHLRWNPPPPFQTRFFEKKPSKKTLSRLTELATVETAAKYLAGKADISPQEFEYLKKLYAGEVAYLDNRLGKLFDFLKTKKVWNNTFLIFVSDHGENIGEHNLMFHCFSVHNTLTHIPLIFHFPSLLNSHKRIKTKVQTVDILPTILDALNIEFDRKSIQGKSLMKIIQEKPEKYKNRVVFSETKGKMNIYRWIKEKFPEKDWSEYEKDYISCYFGNFKYILSSKGEEFLTNLIEDPEEKNNLSEQTRMLEKLKEGRKILSDFMSKAGAVNRRQKKISLSERQKNILKSAGYIQ